MPFEQRVVLAGSERHALPGAKKLGVVDGDELLQVTVVLHSSAAEGFALVADFAVHHGLEVLSENAEARSLVLGGSAAAMQEAFGTKLENYDVPATGVTYRGRTGKLHIARELEPFVQAVLGLDDRPVAQSHFRISPRATPAGALTPVQVAQLYGFPQDRTGAGQTVAIIELGGGYNPADLTAYFEGLGIAEPSVTAVSVSGAANTTGSDADGEVMLDIEVVGAVAPGAAIVVYFAPNTDAGFFTAVTMATNDPDRQPKVMSISWGQSEDEWTEQARNALNGALRDAANLGITVCVACGDNGSSDGAKDGKVHVDFPSSSPWVLACGGTKLAGNVDGSIASETVWNEDSIKEGATGGGVSRFFGLPDYQDAAGVPLHPETNFAGRGVPDVAGDADPQTGYIVRVSGKQQVIGGTSAVAPLWAGLAALANEGREVPVGFWNAALYKAKDGFHDITSGNNGFYKAGISWDACTGLGTPIGARLAE